LTDHIRKALKDEKDLERKAKILAILKAIEQAEKDGLDDYWEHLSGEMI